MLADPIASIRPTSVDTYFDTLQVWLLQSIDISELKELAGSIHFDPDGLLPRRINGRWWRCLNVNQPKPLTKAVNWLRRHAAYLSRVDLALDLTFQTEPEHIEAAHLLNHHYVQKYARNPDIVHFDTHYAKPRRYANGQLIPRNTVRYSDRPNRFTGEDYCIHYERRFFGKEVLQTIGIYRWSDLLSFDFHHFWSNDFTCYAIDPGRLALAIYNYDNRTNCRRPHQCDIELGKHLATSFPVDQIVCTWRPHIHVRDYLNPLDASHLLPAPTHYTEDNVSNSPDTPLPLCLKDSFNRYKATTTFPHHPNLFNPDLLDPFKPEIRAEFRRRYHLLKQTEKTSSSKSWRHLRKQTIRNHFVSHSVISIHPYLNSSLPDCDTLSKLTNLTKMLSANWSLTNMVHSLNHSDGTESHV